MQGAQALKGVYVLLISLSRDITSCIGALGTIPLERGTYAYVGSSQNNLDKRIARHLSKDKKIHWHIDYLLKEDAVTIKRVLYKEAGKQEECVIAGRLARSEMPVTGFGCSDCNCGAHLFRLEHPETIQNLGMREL